MPPTHLWRKCETSLWSHSQSRDGKVLMKEGKGKKEHLGNLFNHPVPDSPAVHDGDDSFRQSQCQGKQPYAIWNENGPSWSWGTAHFPGVDNIHAKLQRQKGDFKIFGRLFIIVSFRSELDGCPSSAEAWTIMYCVYLKKKKIPVTWTYSPTGFCWDLSTDYLFNHTSRGKHKSTK